MSIDNPVPSDDSAARNYVQAVAFGILGEIPGASSIASIIEERGRQALQKRWSDWAAYTNARLTDLEKRGIQIDRADPEFLSLLLRLARSASETASEDKRKILGSAAANSGPWSEVSYDRREELVAQVESLQPVHFRVLAAIEVGAQGDASSGGPLVPGACFPWVAERTHLSLQDARRVVDTIEQRGLGYGGGEDSTSSPYLHPFGAELLAFVRVT